MAIDFQKKSAVFRGNIGVEDAEVLLEWLLKNPKARLNLGDCQHMHSANLQVLMALQPGISVWPKDADLRIWLESALK